MVTKVIKFAAARDGKKIADFEVDLARLTEEQTLWLLERGVTESIRNSWASIKADDPKAIELSLEAGLDWIKRLNAGEVMRGGGGARLSPLERHLRVVVANWLHKSKGFKMTDAVKAASDPEAILLTLASAKADQTGEDVNTLYVTAYDKFKALAQKRVDEDNAAKEMVL